MVSRCDGLQDRQVGEWQRGQLQQLSLRLQLQHWRSVQPNRTSRSRPVSRVYHLINDLKLFQFLAPRYLLRLLFIGDVPHSRLVLKRKFLVKHRKFEKKKIIYIIYLYHPVYLSIYLSVWSLSSCENVDERCQFLLFVFLILLELNDIFKCDRHIPLIKNSCVEKWILFNTRDDTLLSKFSL